MSSTLESFHDLEVRLARNVGALEKRTAFNEAELERIPAQLKTQLDRSQQRIDFRISQLALRLRKIKNKLELLKKSQSG